MWKMGPEKSAASTHDKKRGRREPRWAAELGGNNVLVRLILSHLPFPVKWIKEDKEKQQVKI